MRFRKLSQRRTLVPLALLAAYACVIMFGGCADKLVLYPTTEPMAAPGMSRVEVGYGQRRIEAWVRRASGSDAPTQAYVLHFCGNASRAEWEGNLVAEEWAGRPVEIWTVNYPGYGGSTGPAQLGAMPGSALAMYDLLQRSAGKKPIYLSGLSLGTTVALHVAASRPCQGIILRNPPPLQRMILGMHGWWNLWLLAGPIAMQIPAGLNSLHNAPHVTVPAVFVMSDEDSVVPPRYQQKVVDAYAGPKRLVHLPHADHNAPIEEPQMQEIRAGIGWITPTSNQQGLRHVNIE